MKKQPSSPPDHLSPAARQFWQAVQQAYDVHDAAGLELLRLAAECLDAATNARAAIQEHGQTYTDRFNAPRPRPEVAILRDSMATFTRLVRTLGIDVPQQEIQK